MRAQGNIKPNQASDFLSGHQKGRLILSTAGLREWRNEPQVVIVIVIGIRYDRLMETECENSLCSDNVYHTIIH